MSFRKIFCAAAVLLGVLSVASAQGAVLVGSATLHSADDLTVIKDGKRVYEFLDLTATLGASHRNALTRFGPEGFALATNLDMARLFTSFGFGAEYGSKREQWGYTLDATETQATQFISYLGNTTFGYKSVGSFIDLDFGPSGSCVAVSGCWPTSFVTTIDRSQSTYGWGIYLVREASDSASEVPEPASIALLALGAAGLLAARRRQK